MKLDFASIEKCLSSNKSILVDETNLNDDLKVMYNYYSESDDVDIPECIMEYYNHYDRLSEIEFAKAYIKSIVGFDVQFERTDDGWIRLTKQ
jgi:hypothetical protein